MRQTEKARVTGRVQGVWFRRFVQSAARARGVEGYAENLPDGSVEVLLSGEPDAVTAVKREVAKGPPGAKVENIDWQSSPEGGISGFEVR